MDTGMAAQGVGLGVWAYWLVIGFPTLLFVLLLALGRLERWMIRPDERAAEVTRVLEQTEGADEVEVAVTRLLADVPRRAAPAPADGPRSSPAGPAARRGRRRAGQHAAR